MCLTCQCLVGQHDNVIISLTTTVNSWGLLVSPIRGPIGLKDRSHDAGRVVLCCSAELVNKLLINKGLPCQHHGFCPLGLLVPEFCFCASSCMVIDSQEEQRPAPQAHPLLSRLSAGGCVLEVIHCITMPTLWFLCNQCNCR